MPCSVDMVESSLQNPVEAIKECINGTYRKDGSCEDLPRLGGSQTSDQSQSSSTTVTTSTTATTSTTYRATRTYSTYALPHNELNLAETPQLVRVPSNSGRISPASVAFVPRRMSSAVVTAYYSPNRARPELELMLRGRPTVKLNPFALPSPPSQEGIEIETAEEDEIEMEQKQADSLIDMADLSSQLDDAPLLHEDEDDDDDKKPATNLPEANNADEGATQTDTDTLLRDEKEDDDDDDDNKPATSLPETNNTDESTTRTDTDTSWTLDPRPLSLETWAEQPAEEFKVRGANYLEDGLKENSEASVLKLFAVDLIQVPEPLWQTGLSQHPEERIQRALRREAATGRKELPDFVFVVNLLVPSSNCFYHWVTYFGTNETSALTDTSTPFGKVAKPFFFGGHDLDAYRTSVFKLIPRVADGNFVVRSAVGSRPTLLGRKMKQHFIFDDQGTNEKPRRYLEILIDISSNPVANRIVKLVLGYAKSLAVDLMFLLEGGGDQQPHGEKQNDDDDEEEDEEIIPKMTLPERILGGVRIKNIDFVQAQRPCTMPTPTDDDDNK